jgi:DNA-directed RNA polymerase specialized sigma24 family protein
MTAQFLPPICLFDAVVLNAFPGYVLSVFKTFNFVDVYIQQRRSKSMLYRAAIVSRRDICEMSLHHLDGYIVSQVQRLGRCYSRDFHPAVLDLELDEIVQRVRIKFWQALEKREIHYPYAYIKLIIQSEFIDMKRRKKPYQSLPIDEEFVQTEIEITTPGITDPAEAMAQQMDTSVCLKELIQAVLALPPRQQYAVICTLKDRVDDLKQLTEAFRAYKMDIQAIQWPAAKAEKELLYASLAPAKKTLAKSLGRTRRIGRERYLNA